MEILLRKATLADMPAVYNLVYELAVYEKEPEALKIGVEAYAEAFSENLIDCVVAEKGTEIIGSKVKRCPSDEMAGTGLERTGH